MGLRFDSTLGVVELVRWNARESVLMLRLGLLQTGQHIRARNLVPALRAGRTKVSSPAGVPHAATDRRSAQEGEIQELKKPRLLAEPRAARGALAMAVMAACFLTGYFTGRVTVPEVAPAIVFSTSQVEAPAPSTSEVLASLSWASPMDEDLEASWAPPPEVSMAKFANASNTESQPINTDEVREVQAWLKAFGFYHGPVDGVSGPLTATAVKRYRIARKIDEAGGLDRSILKQVRQQSGH